MCGLAFASTHYRKRAVIDFDVAADLVSIIGVFYRGQDYVTILHDDTDEWADRIERLKLSE